MHERAADRFQFRVAFANHIADGGQIPDGGVRFPVANIHQGVRQNVKAVHTVFRHSHFLRRVLPRRFLLNRYNFAG